MIFRQILPALRLLLFLFLACLSGRSQGIPVYLEPDAASSPIATLDPASLATIDAMPVLDEARAAQGWMFSEYNGTFRGFIDPALVQGDAVKPGTPAFLRPDRNSPVLSVILEGDTVRVTRRAADWVEVEFQKLIPVYFLGAASPAAPDATAPATAIVPAAAAASAPAEDTPIPVQPVTRLQDTPESLPAPPAETPPASAPELEPLTTAPGTAPPLVRPGELGGAGQPWTQPNAPAVDIPRSIQGRLVRAGRNWRGARPPYVYELQAPGAGDRIAWVDLSDTVMTSVGAFLNRDVILYGAIVEVSGQKVPLVRVQLIKLR